MALDTRLVALQTVEERIDLLVRGERFATYRHANNDLLGFSALYAPGERRVTHPAETGPALWLAHGNVNGVAFGVPTSDGPSGKIVLREIVARRGSQTVGFQRECDWRGPDDALLLTEVSTVRALPGPGMGGILDLDIRLRAPDDRHITFGRTEHSLLMLRVASALCAEGIGQMRNSRGDYGPDAIHGREAAWCACVGVVQGATVGIAFLAHPSNPYSPSPWNCRRDGTLSPSPFAWREEQLPPGRTLRLRYRLHVYQGYVETGWADARLAEFARE
jgi:hypothetical protein